MKIQCMWTKRELKLTPCSVYTPEITLINDSPIHHGDTNLASPPLNHWVRVLALQVQFHTMRINHHQNAYACTTKACNIQLMEYDHNIIPYNINTTKQHMITV